VVIGKHGGFIWIMGYGFFKSELQLRQVLVVNTGSCSLGYEPVHDPVSATQASSVNLY
jgi:hypothetical protein